MKPGIGRVSTFISDDSLTYFFDCTLQVKLIVQEESKASGGYIDYIATMCGVIGGVITVLG